MWTSEISSSEVRLSKGDIDEDAIVLEDTASTDETRRNGDEKGLTV